jgi:hypothetical protein
MALRYKQINYLFYQEKCIQIRESIKASIPSNAKICCVSCNDPFMKKKNRALCVCLKDETQKGSLAYFYQYQGDVGFWVRLSSSHNLNLEDAVTKFCVWTLWGEPKLTTHTTTNDKHFIAAVAGSRIKGVIWLKAISKEGMGLHSNTSLYLSSFCGTFY